ncbi:MAG TPA: histidine kinase [Cyclobacteriaceae bacterium]|nr:histidine kinase [Cyclobacteriaceae bacterium]
MKLAQRLICFSCLFACLLNPVADAQQLIEKPNIELIGIDDGYPFNSVTSMLQDRDGFLWITSQNGIVRYDGYRFAQVDVEQSLPTITLHVVEDQQGFLWFGHYEGYVTKLNPRTKEKWTYRVKETKSEVTQLYCDSQNRIWASVRTEGLFLLNEKNVFEFVAALPQKFYHDLPKNWTNQIVRFYEENDHLWLGTQRGLYQFNIVTKKLEDYLPFTSHPNDALAINSINKINGVLWLGSSEGLIGFDPTTKVWKKFTYETASNNITSAVFNTAQKNEKEFWVAATVKGLGAFNTETEKFSFFYDDEDDSNPLCYMVYADHSGILWGASIKGLCKWNLSGSKFLFTQLKTRQIYRALQYIVTFEKKIANPARTIVSTMYAGGLYIRDNNTGKISPKKFNTAPWAESQMISYGVYTDLDSNVWIVTRDYLYRLTSDNQLIEETGLTKILPKGELSTLYRMLIASNGDVWVISTRQGAYLKKRNTNQWIPFTKENNQLASNSNVRVLEDDNHRIWFEHTDAGLTVYDPKKGSFEFINTASHPSLTSNPLTDMTKTPDGNVWVGSIDGVFVFGRNSNKIVRTLTRKSGLPSDFIYSIVGDSTGNVWLTSDKGLTVIQTSGAIKTFNHIDGLRGDYTTFLLKKTEHNLLRIYTRLGFYTFDPNEVLKKNAFDAPVRITAIHNKTKSIFDVTQPIAVEYKENAVSFEFAALNFQHPQRNKYQYKIEGLDDDWLETSDHVVNYSGLPSGNFSFVVKSIGQPNASAATVKLIVATPFWRASWFVLLVGALLSLLFYFAFKLRAIAIRKEEQMKSEMKRKLADVEMKALRAQMSPHFIFNSLNSINRYIVKSDPHTASSYLTKFSKLMRLILENSNQKIITLEQELNALKLYIELEALRFNNKFSYNLIINDKVDSTIIGVPPMVIQPFIENAIWHGLLHKDSAGLLQIFIDPFDEGVQCIILDNGIGRRKASELKSKSITNDKSFGMKITADRLNMVKGSSNASTVEIVDLEDKEGRALGTKVIVKIFAVELESEI